MPKCQNFCYYGIFVCLMQIWKTLKFTNPENPCSGERISNISSIQIEIKLGLHLNIYIFIPCQQALSSSGLNSTIKLADSCKEHVSSKV